MVKPTIVRGFDYKAMAWVDLPDADEIAALMPANDETLSPVV